MSSNFIQNKLYRNSAIAFLKFYSRILIWRTGERVFINSIPKAGTHLLTSIIEEMPGMMNSRIHLNVEDVSEYKHSELALTNFTLSKRKLASILDRVNGGQFITAHLPWSEDLERMLKERNFKILNLDRNSEAILLSRLHYIMELKRHHLHHQLKGQYPDFEARVNALRAGFPPSRLGPGTESFDYILDAFKNWKGRTEVLNLTFEELVGEKGGGDQRSRLDAIDRIMTFLNIRSDMALIQKVHVSSQDKKTATLRAGRINTTS
ncbi:hypothetical protein FT643_17490 [Ketobacter sp. MCCC 1A13808]|uniref:sulfotransferase domain-containing protein n=1 Tax=Ketobacter sp. MCCC 1A13808 TaxID=2602738 RepID=UPI0012EC45B8|nr:sulfotransferase domain-containing protein [Ketobacter sp. MCCC 1A13808]MVF13936.1 hypothetical protein [Ketobacter sp. MCCC 1A13808]